MTFSSKSKRVTLADVAKAISVHKSTVSLALRNDARLPAETRRRICRQAAQMGYRINPVVARLMAELRRNQSARYRATLGYIDTTPHHALQWDAYLAYRKGVLSQCEKLGYSLDYFHLPKFQDSTDALHRICRTRGIEGLIFFWPRRDEFAPSMRPLWKNRACAITGARPVLSRLSAATADHFQSGRLSVRKAVEAGYRGIAVAYSADHDLLTDRRFSSGYLAGIRDFPELNPIPPFVIGPEPERNFQFWFTKHRPDCIITVVPRVVGWARVMGLRLPEDLGLILWEIGSWDDFGWAGIKNDPADIGAMTVDLVIGQLHRNEVGAPSITKWVLKEGVWVDGPSLPKR